MDRAAAPASPDPVVEAYKRDVDRALIRERPKRSVEERLEALAELEAIREERDRGGTG